MIWWRRVRVRHYGDCPRCAHDWREHPTSADGGGSCSECRYEIDHDEPRAPLSPCTFQAPTPQEVRT